MMIELSENWLEPVEFTVVGAHITWLELKSLSVEDAGLRRSAELEIAQLAGVFRYALSALNFHVRSFTTCMVRLLSSSIKLRRTLQAELRVKRR